MMKITVMMMIHMPTQFLSVSYIIITFSDYLSVLNNIHVLYTMHLKTVAVPSATVLKKWYNFSSELMLIIQTIRFDMIWEWFFRISFILSVESARCRYVATRSTTSKADRCSSHHSVSQRTIPSTAGTVKGMECAPSRQRHWKLRDVRMS